MFQARRLNALWTLNKTPVSLLNTLGIFVFRIMRAFLHFRYVLVIPLFQRSFPETQFVLRENPPNLQLLNPEIDYQIPMGSLGRWLRADEDSFKQSKTTLPDSLC